MEKVSTSSSFTGVTGLARQIALPSLHRPTRYPSFPALERTAVIGFSQPANLTLPSNLDIKVLQFRQACWPSWADWKCVFLNSLTFTSDSIRSDGGPSVHLRPEIREWAVDSKPVSVFSPEIVNTGPSTSIAFKYPIIGSDVTTPGTDYLYMPAGSSCAIVLKADVPAPQDMVVNIDFETWQSPGKVSSAGQAVSFTVGESVAGIIFTASSSQWYRVVNLGIPCASPPFGHFDFLGVTLITSSSVLTLSTVGGGTVSVQAWPANSFLFPLVQPAEFTNSNLPWRAARVTASSFLGTNVSQVLAKGGTILGGRLSPAVENAWLVTPAVVSNLHPAEKAFLALETGVYTYCPPSTDLIFFHDYTANVSYRSGVALIDTPPVFRLDNDSLYNVMFITASDAAQSEALACTTTWHMEFRTSSALFQVALCGMTLESLHAAQLVLAKTGFFFENPIHEKILNAITGFARRYGPAALSFVAPHVGQFLGSFGKTIKPKPGPSAPPTTSAAASGMTPSLRKLNITRSKPVRVARKAKAKVAKSKK
jgi:hypothetical protein